MTKLDPSDQIDMGDGRMRPRIVVIMTSTTIGQRLNKSHDEAEALAQAAFNKLHTDDHYPTEAGALGPRRLGGVAHGGPAGHRHRSTV